MSDSGDKIDQRRDAALNGLIRTIEATGGLVSISGKDIGMDSETVLVPKGDTEREWCDLADAYLEACEAMDVRPLIDGKRKGTPSVSHVEIVLERSVNEESRDEDTEAVHAMAALLPEDVTLVRVLDCDGVFLYYADGREGS